MYFILFRFKKVDMFVRKKKFHLKRNIEFSVNLDVNQIIFFSKCSQF